MTSAVRVIYNSAEERTVWIRPLEAIQFLTNSDRKWHVYESIILMTWSLLGTVPGVDHSSRWLLIALLLSNPYTGNLRSNSIKNLKKDVS